MKSVIQLTSLFFQNNIEHFKKVAIFFIVYCGVKSLVYFAPLFVSHLATDINEYGKFEYSLNLGYTFAGILAMGLNNAYPYFILKQKKQNIEPIFYLHSLVVWLILLIALMLIPGALNSIGFSSLLIAAAVSNQYIISSILKSEEKSIKAVIIDSGIYLILGLLCLLVFSRVLPLFKTHFFNLAIFIYSIFFVFVSNLDKIGGFKRVAFQDYLMVYKYGFSIIIAYFLVYLLTNNTRMFIGNFLNFQDVGVYSFYFRLASFVVIFHQVINIVFFKKIYISKPADLDKYYSVFVFGIFLLNLLVAFIIPLILKDRSAIFNDTYEANKNLFIVIVFQVVFWIIFALLENIIYRENLAFPFNLGLGLLVASMVLILWILKVNNSLSLELLVTINSVTIMLAIIYQLSLLFFKEVYLKKTSYVLMFISLVFIVFQFIQI
jgi:hypothetical protein